MVFALVSVSIFSNPWLNEHTNRHMHLNCLESYVQFVIKNFEVSWEIFVSEKKLVAPRWGKTPASPTTQVYWEDWFKGMSKKHASAAFNSHQTLVWAKYQHPNNQQVKNNKRSHVLSNDFQVTQKNWMKLAEILTNKTDWLHLPIDQMKGKMLFSFAFISTCENVETISQKMWRKSFKYAEVFTAVLLSRSNPQI